MRTLHLFLILSFSGSALAEQVIDADRVESFLQKNRKCYLAVSLQVMIKGLCPHRRCIESVMCFENLTLSPGTMYAKQGCTLASYNPRNDQYSYSLGPLHVEPARSSKPCEKGGLEEVLGRKTRRLTDVTSVTTLRRALFDMKPGAPFKPIVLYSAEPSALELWNKQ